MARDAESGGAVVKISDKELRDSARHASERIGQRVQSMSVNAPVLHALASELLASRAEVRRMRRELRLARDMCDSPIVGWTALGKYLDKALARRGGRKSK